MNFKIPIQMSPGLHLQMKCEGVHSVSVTNPLNLKNLPWDRYVRLNAAAKAILNFRASTVLDVGGYDGAIGYFLPNTKIDLVDPATTGGSILQLPVADQSYECVIAVDVLEHIEPTSRKTALSELCRVAQKYVILNYPCQDSKEAQALALKLTGNSLIREHVDWELPDTNWVLAELYDYGFSGQYKGHTSIAIWLGQYALQTLSPEAAIDLNQHLVEHYSEEPQSKPLYHLLSCERRTN